MRIIGFILPNLISSFYKTDASPNKINNINVQIKIIDKSLGEDIALPKFNSEGSAGLDLRTNIKESIILSHLLLLVFQLISIYQVMKKFQMIMLVIYFEQPLKI